MCQKEDILSKVFFYFCDISPPTRSTRDRVEKKAPTPVDSWDAPRYRRRPYAPGYHVACHGLSMRPWFSCLVRSSFHLR